MDDMTTCGCATTQRVPYQPPKLEVFEFAVERGFAQTTIHGSTNTGLIQMTEFTDKNGENEKGYWDDF